MNGPGRKPLLTRLADLTGFDSRQADLYAVLLSAPLLLTLYVYRFSAASFAGYFPSLASTPLADALPVLFQWVSFFVLVLVLPLSFALLRMKKRPSDLGLAFGDWKAGAKALAFLLPLLVLPMALASSRLPDVRAEYPLARVLLDRHELVLWYETAYVLIYYFAWEFYFRGFLLFSLERSFGGLNAVLVSTIPSCLVHIGKPEGEIMGSVLAGLILGVLALRTRSFLYGWVLHVALGVAVDLLILFS